MKRITCTEPVFFNGVLYGPGQVWSVSKDYKLWGPLILEEDYPKHNKGKRVLTTAGLTPNEDGSYGPDAKVSARTDGRQTSGVPAAPTSRTVI